MKNAFIMCSLLAGFAGRAGADIKLVEKTSVVFASVDEGRKILTQRDDFVQRLSPFDRAARMKTAREVSEETYLRFVATNVLAWTDKEKAAVESAVSNLQPRLGPLALPWPQIVYMIKTTGEEEGHAAYTRGAAIVLPINELARANGNSLGKLIGHELFHVLSRRNPDLRERCYAAIGFQKCDEIAFPSKLAPLKITNPDAPRNDHCIRVQFNGSQTWGIPILFARTAYDEKRGGEFFQYMDFKFLLVEREKSGAAAVSYDNANLKLVNPDEVSGFFEQVGQNTQYIIHPEEILADNFALLAQGRENVPSPEILRRIRNALTDARQPAASASTGR